MAHQDVLINFADNLDGELSLSRSYRRIYATDASIYAREPQGVAFPKNRRDLLKLIDLAQSIDLPLIPRTAGTSLAGQVVGDSLVIDLGRHMSSILELDHANRQLRAQPGVIQDVINRLVLPHGLVFGPDTSTGSRAMIGGMIGNNSCGSHSILYGTTRDHLIAAEVLLADGSRAILGDWSLEEMEGLISKGGPVGRIIEGMREIVSGGQEAIRNGFPDPSLSRRNTGYALDYLLQTVLANPDGHPLNLAKFLCGSEGTLAIVTEATLNLEKLPRHKGLMAAHFASIDAALEANILAVSKGPSAVELIDRKLLDLTKSQIEQRRNRFFLEGDPEAVLIVEFYGDSTEEVFSAIADLSALLESEGSSYACTSIPDDKAHRVWDLRKAGLGLLMGTPGDAKPLAFVEDTAVTIDRQPEYIARFEEIMTRHEVDCVYYGHAAVGELHLRPVLDLKRREDVRKLELIAGEVADLVAEFGGALSGEHGDGRVRSPFIGRVMGVEVVDMFEQVKRLWDPTNLLNPGKIVNPLPVDQDLRYNRSRDTPEVDSFLGFHQDRGLVRAVERCNGAGVCRKPASAGGTMCPSYMATGDELHSTRGRANLFRRILWEDDPSEVFQSKDLYEAFQLCLQCKGCKAECPASVDMAKLKTEFLQHYWDEHGVPLKIRMVAFIAGLNRVGMLFPRLVNWLFRNRVLGGWFRSAMGVHPKRELPLLARMSFRKWFATHHQPQQEATAGKVALFIDEFTDYNDTEVGKAAVEVLERLGFEVLAPKHSDSARPLLSKGQVRAAAVRARDNVKSLLPLVEKGIPILGLEPSAALGLVDEYPDLVPESEREAAQRVADKTLLIEDFLVLEHNKRDLSSYFDRQDRHILLHGHCHQKALVGAEGSLQALRIPTGHRVEMIDSGCCGMGGSFGYEKEHYELSMKIAEQRLLPAIRGAEESTLIAAPGISCRHQIGDGVAGSGPSHPIQILRSALR